MPFGLVIVELMYPTLTFDIGPTVIACAGRYGISIRRLLASVGRTGLLVCATGVLRYDAWVGIVRKATYPNDLALTEIVEPRLKPLDCR